MKKNLIAEKQMAREVRQAAQRDGGFYQCHHGLKGIEARVSAAWRDFWRESQRTRKAAL